MNIVNLTGIKINIYGEDKKFIMTLNPDELPAQCTQKREVCGYVGDIPIYRINYGNTFDVPLPQEDTIYIVSESVARAVKRPDTFCVGTEVRDKNGRVIGYNGLSCG